MMYAMFSILIASILLLCSALSYKTVNSMEKSSPFECGFDPSGVSRLPFCMKFFLISIIFLVFDVEVTLILPMIHSSYLVLNFIFILLIGLYYEWSYGGLEWIV